VDTGASISFISENICDQLSLEKRVVKTEHILLPNKSTIISNREVTVRLKLEDLTVELDLRVIPVLQWDIILGLDFRQRFVRVGENYATQCVELQESDGTRYYIPFIQDKGMDLLSTKQVKRMLRKKKRLYIAFLSDDGTVCRVGGDYVDQLNESGERSKRPLPVLSRRKNPL